MAGDARQVFRFPLTLMGNISRQSRRNIVPAFVQPLGGRLHSIHAISRITAGPPTPKRGDRMSQRQADWKARAARYREMARTAMGDADTAPTEELKAEGLRIATELLRLADEIDRLRPASGNHQTRA